MDPLLKRITINPDQNFGKPSIRGMRIRVEDVLGMLSAGDTAEDILEGYSYLKPDDTQPTVTPTPLRILDQLDTFGSCGQRTVTGTVRFKLYKGNLIVAGRKAPRSLYREDYASFGHMDVYDQTDAEGFINLFGLPLQVEALVDIEGTGRSKYRAPDYSKFKRD